MRLVVARRVRPVLILPIRDETVFAQAVSPVVPGLATRGIVGDAVLLECALDDGKDEVSELVNGVLPEHRAVNVAGHVKPRTPSRTVQA